MPDNLSKKLGQLFFIGFEGYTLSRKTIHFLETIQPGGIIFFEHNIKNKKQVKSLIKNINNLIEIKPFITIDQEGGSVERLRDICTSIPSAWGLAKVGLKELLTAHEIIIYELLDLGFNMNLAPVLDINSNFANPVIGTRSLSNDSKIVSEYGSEIIKLYLKHNIIPVAKHFPGHGDLNIDSHLSMPILNKSLVELNNKELIPFKKAIQNKVPVIMAGHIQVPKIESDKKRPASISKDILSGLLRQTLKYKGLIITDELNMKGVTRNYSLTTASCKAINAGANLLLFNSQEKLSLKIFNYINKISLKKERNLLNKINDSYKKIIETKQRFLYKKVKQKTIKKQKKNYKQIACKLASKVVHWVKKDLFFQSINKNQLEIIYPTTPKLREKDLKIICNELNIKKYSLISYNLNPSFKNVQDVVNKLRKTKKRRILITYDIQVRKGQKSLINNILKIEPDLIVISVGLEYDLILTPKIKNFISAYAPNYISLLAAFKKLKE